MTPSTDNWLEDPNDPGTYIIQSASMPVSTGQDTSPRTQLAWGASGNRFFETGIDRGVLYPPNSHGVAWNGLISVNESSENSAPIPYYLDGIKYLNESRLKEFKGRIEAFTYPDEFIECEGWAVLDNGLVVDEQRAKPFGFSYRTRIGNDVVGQDYGYKIHVIYGALATPSEKTYSSTSNSAEPTTFSWDFTTSATIGSSTLAPISHIVIDSTKTNITQLSFIEQYLYGTPSSKAALPPLVDMLKLFANPVVTVTIDPNELTGLNMLIESDTLVGDLRGRFNEGTFMPTRDSRLNSMIIPGLYSLET